MAVQEIRLESGRFNGWMESQQNRLTKARDALVQMESQAGGLTHVWESSAGRQWESVLMQRLLEVGECLSRMEALLTKTRESAGMLIRVERELRAEAESLG